MGEQADAYLTLAELVDSPQFPLPDDSAPARFARLLAKLLRDWRVEPESDASDFFFSAMAPDGSERSVGITADWPPEAGYRAVDEWTVHGHGPHRVGIELHLCHDTGQPEFEVVRRLLRAAWTER